MSTHTVFGMNYIAMILILAGCLVQGQDTGSENSLPVESVSCSHPDSDYEAVVEVVVEDDGVWEDIHFQIHQDEETWDTLLWKPDDEEPAWRTRMQLIELNCRIEYDYDFLYITAVK